MELMTSPCHNMIWPPRFLALPLGAEMIACGGGNSGESKSNPSGPLPDVIGDCGVAENGAGTALTALQQGHYQDALVSGGTQATCPSECLWQSEAGQCVAPWAPP